VGDRAGAVGAARIRTAPTPGSAKSMYASSTTRMPLKRSYSSSERTMLSGTSVPVRFPGEQRKMSLIAGSASTAFSICCVHRALSRPSREKVGAARLVQAHEEPPVLAALAGRDRQLERERDEPDGMEWPSAFSFASRRTPAV
jgi:hypothetical protein